MRKLFILLLVTFFIFIHSTIFAQYKDWGSKYGFQVSLLFPENEYANLGFSGNDNFSFDWFKASFLGEAFLGVELSEILELRFSAGYGSYTGKAVFAEGTDYGEYKSTIMPLTAKLRISPFDLKSWNPYLYAGTGIMKYNIDTEPDVVSPVEIKSSGWVANIPVGFGAEFNLSDGILLDITLGGALGSTWDLDAYNSETSKIWDSYIYTSAGLTFTYENCSSDKDMDELGKCDEESAGTDPANPDTDEDGLTDGMERNKYRTNPLKSDTDADGLVDGMEVQNTKTNPLIADTDKDQLTDGEEFRKHRTNPLIKDTDNDGLDDNYEVNIIKTNPLLADTDKDELKDGEEVNTYRTSPLKEDTDGEGLTDFEELFKNKTNPLKKDTDEGSVNDLVEVVRGSDPFNRDDDVEIEVGASIVLEGITFSTGNAEITPESEQVLIRALNTLRNNPDIVVEIGGHTDNVGSSRSNEILSKLRADAVRGWLIMKGISADRVTTFGYGEENPRVSNNTSENRRLNRRIEFKRIR